MILEDLMLIDKEMVARIIPFGGSNHWPLQLEVQGIGTPKNRNFRFENIWLTHPDFISNIANWWFEDLHIQGTRMFLLHKRLKHIKLRLKDWNKNEFGNIFEGKNLLKTNCRKSTKPLSRLALIKLEMFKLPIISKNGRIHVNKRKYFGDKNLEFNGLKKERETLDFSIDPPWQTKLITESLRSRMRESNFLIPTKI